MPSQFCSTFSCVGFALIYTWLLANAIYFDHQVAIQYGCPGHEPCSVLSYFFFSSFKSLFFFSCGDPREQYYTAVIQAKVKQSRCLETSNRLTQQPFLHVPRRPSSSQSWSIPSTLASFLLPTTLARPAAWVHTDDNI
jgi:hypothetical protein